MVFSLSIIIPIYNAEKFITKTLNSIVQQQNYTFPVQIIAIDDGSIDQSVSIIKAYQRDYKQLKLITQANMGAGSARNRGLEQVVGSHIWFIDADDFIEPDAFQHIEGFFKDRDLEKTVAFNYYVLSKENVKSNNNLSHNQQDIERFNGLDFTLSNKPFYLWNMIMCAAVINKNELRFTENIKNIEDFEFSLKYFSRATTVVYHHVRLYNYYENENSTSRSRTHQNLLKLAADSHVVHKGLKNYAINNAFDQKEILENWIKYSVLGFFFSLLTIGYNKQNILAYYQLYTIDKLLPIHNFKGSAKQKAFIRVLNNKSLFKILVTFSVLVVRPVKS